LGVASVGRFHMAMRTCGRNYAKLKSNLC